MRNLLRTFSRTRSRREAPRKAAAYRPSLEGLEIRSLLSASNSFLQTNLVSDISGIAQVTDPKLINPWGLTASPSGPFWVSDNNAGVSTLYNGAGTPQSLVVHIPGPTGSPADFVAAPTGVVFNGTGGFKVMGPKGVGSALFIFATEDGTISGWSPSADPTHAILEVDNSANPTPAAGAVYKGLATGTDPDGRNLLFAANFRAGTVDVFDAAFHPTSVGATFSSGGAFNDPNLPAGFAPFDVQNINGKLYVTYALQNAAKHDDVAGAHNGVIDVYNTDGFLLKRLVTGGPLNSPWGLAVAPKGFGPFSGDLLVGNFGDGRINAFDLKTGHFDGTLNDVSGNPVVIGGLWALRFGNGGAAGSKNTLFFTAGINDEKDGLFGSLQATQPVVFGTDKKASDILQTNLVSNISGIAQLTDPNLQNPWGIASAPGGTLWVADNGAGLSTLYSVNQLKGTSIAGLVVNIPLPKGATAPPPAAPTGVVFNNTASDFVVSAAGKTGKAAFIFATEDGTISAWSPAVDVTHAILEVDNSAIPTPAAGAVYKGLAIGTNSAGSFLYATNFRAGTVDVFDTHFKEVSGGGAFPFSDPAVPAGFAPFGIQNINGTLYVTYAKQNASKHDDVAGLGNGYVAQFDLSGKLIRTVAMQGVLNSPWGLALAPSTFGKFAGDLLVGNFGDGHITAFDPATGKEVGQLTDGRGNLITIGGLWGLKFGTGGNGGDPNTLYFTAGINDEQDGLFGSLQTIHPIVLQH